MKIALLLILTIALCLCFCACGGATEPEVTDAAPVTTPTVAQDPIDALIKEAKLQYPGSNELFKYNVYDTYVEITEFIGDNTLAQITVPATLENLPVYVVKREAFKNCGVADIYFEEGIHDIGSGFSADLIGVSLPSTLDRVGAFMFENCFRLEKVELAEGIESISSSAFKHCDALKEITIPGSVTYLGNEAFAFCIGLETVNLCDGLKIIASDAFNYCKALKTITIPATVEKLEYHVFMSSGLEYIEIPESVKQIGSGTFSACENLTTVKIYSADVEFLPMKGYNVVILFSQHNEQLVVHGRAGSTIAQVCADEEIFFEVIQ